MCRLHIDSFMDLAYNQNNLRQAGGMRIAYRRITKALDSDIWRLFVIQMSRMKAHAGMRKFKIGIERKEGVLP